MKVIMTKPEASSNPNRTRDHLSNERTYLAWIRTALSLIGFGFVVVRFRSAMPSVAATPNHSLTLGLLFCCVGLLLVPFANWQYFRVMHTIENENFEPSQRAISIASTLIFLIGVGVVIYLLLYPNTATTSLSTNP